MQLPCHHLQCFMSILGLRSKTVSNLLNPPTLLKKTKKQHKSKVPKAVISMKDLNAVFQTEKVGHAHGLQISYLQDERTRNLFVYHEKGQVGSTSIVLFYFHL